MDDNKGTPILGNPHIGSLESGQQKDGLDVK